MTTHEFDNQASQAERREVLRNDTYFARQSNTVDDAGGRYAKLTPSNVIGSATSPQYPQQPENSPWHHDPVAATEPHWLLCRCNGAGGHSCGSASKHRTGADPSSGRFSHY